MWTLISFIYLLSLCCAAYTVPPSPTNVSFSSINLRNVLHWIPGRGSSINTYFTVEYAIYGDSVEGNKGRRVNWKAVWQCRDIIRTWCDLSTETWDVEHGYYARVRAVGRKSSSKWVVTPRFDPKSDTTFGPPLVSLEIENNSFIVTLVGPMRYPVNNHTTQVSMGAIYPHMTYSLFINNTHRNQTHQFSVDSSPHKYPISDYNTEYCFSAESRFLSMPVQCQMSDWHCITTPEGPFTKQLKKVIVGIVVLFLCLGIIIVSGSCLHKYLSGKGQKSPITLDPPSFHPPPLTFPPDNLNIFLISVVSDKLPWDYPHSEPLPAIPDPPPVLLPRRFEILPPPEETGEDSSGGYGSVLIAAPVEEDHGTGEVGNGGNIEGREDEDAIYAKQAMPYFLKMNSHTFEQTRVQTEVSTLEQAHPWSQENSTLPAQIPYQSQCHQESVTEELNKNKEKAHPGLFIRKNSQTGLFDVFSGLHAQESVAGRNDADEEEGCKFENVPLLSTYARQNNKNIPMTQSIKPDCFAEDQGFQEFMSEQNTDDFTDYDEMEGTIHVNWDPQTRKLVLPLKEMGFMINDELDEFASSESERKESIAGEDEMNVSGTGLHLENVFVSQTSVEDTEEEDVFTEWKLVIPRDK